jgi:hypothetical protein
VVKIAPEAGPILGTMRDIAVQALLLLALATTIDGAFVVKHYRFELQDSSGNSRYEDGKYEVRNISIVRLCRTVSRCTG